MANVESPSRASQASEVIEVDPYILLNIVLRRDVLREFPFDELQKLFQSDAVTLWLEDHELNVHANFLAGSRCRPELENKEHEIYYIKGNSYVLRQKEKVGKNFFILSEKKIKQLSTSISHLPGDFKSFSKMFVICLVNAYGLFGSLHFYYNRPVWMTCNSTDMERCSSLLSLFLDSVKHERDSLLIERRKIGHEIARKFRECNLNLDKMKTSIDSMRSITRNSVIKGLDSLGYSLETSADTIDNDTFIEGALKRSARSRYINLINSLQNTIDISKNTSDRLNYYSKIVMSVPNSVEIKIDPTDFDLMMSNILENAIKYSASGAQINLTFKNDGVTGSIVTSNLSNKISTKECELVWNYRYRGSNSAGKKGTGVGLSVVSDICGVYGLNRKMSQRPSGLHHWTDVVIVFSRDQYRIL